MKVARRGGEGVIVIREKGVERKEHFFGVF